MTAYSECIATAHAYKRARERLGWSKSTLDRMIVRIYTEGLSHDETKGRLYHFIANSRSRYEITNNTRIYGEVIYFFRDNTLITMYRLNNDLIKYLKLSKRIQALHYQDKLQFDLVMRYTSILK